MKYRIITIISFIGSTVISLLGGWDKSLQTLIIFMTIDWLTGGILLPVVFQKSPKSQNDALESHAGWKGLCRKAMTLFYVLVGAQLDSLMCKLRSNGMPVPLLRNGYSIFNGTKYR